MAETRLSNPVNWCLTKSEMVPITFRWTIQNFSHHIKQVGYKLTSSTFCSPEVKDKSKWHLEAYPKGNNIDSENYLSLYLAFEPDSTQEATVIFQFALLSSKARKSFNGPKSRLHQFNNSTDSLGWPKFISINKLLDENSELVKDDTLTIYCELELSSASTNNYGKIPNKKIPECRFGDDLSKLFDNEFLSDVTLTACGKHFKVHKAILAARSPVFAAMFLTEMKEKIKAVIEIGDIDDDVLYYLLHFIYSGKAPEEASVKLASDLLVAADKYDLERLKVMCEKILVPQLTIENAVELLILADLHNAEELKEIALNFVNTYLNAIKITHNWTFLVQGHPSLLDEIFSYHLQQGLKIKDV